jgi:hypothetical protein
MLSLAAIHKITGEYTHPNFAKKTEQFICPECRKDLILCQGQVNIHHFRHNVDSINPCNYYNNPGETALHKDAKELMKSILNKCMHITMNRKCSQCSNNNIAIEIKTQNDNTSTELEYRFEYLGSSKIADVAYLHNGNIKYIFEICNTHKTSEEDRPEPWFEIDAIKFIKSFGENSNQIIFIDCIRIIKSNIYSDVQDKNVCNNCFQDYMIETKKITKCIDTLGNTEDNQKYIFDVNCCLYDFIVDNQKIINLFNNRLDNIRAIIFGWSNQIYAYIFDEVDYQSNLKNLSLKYNGSIQKSYFDELNWKSVIDYGSYHNYQSDENIIYDLIQFSKTGISKIGNIEKNDNYKKKRENNRIYLNVYYSDKDKIKDIGGKWDAERKLWYVSQNIYLKNEDFISSFCALYKS